METKKTKKTKNGISFGRGVPAHAALIGVKSTILQGWADAIREYTGAELLQYSTPGVTDPLGLVGLRKLIAESFAPGVEGVQTIATNGGMEAISLLLLHLLPARHEPQPTLLVEAMTYNRVIETAVKLGYKVIGLPMTTEGVDTDLLDVEIQSAFGRVVFYQVSPHNNPSGLTTPVEQVKRAGQICAVHNGNHIVDVAYQDLRLDGAPNELVDIANLPATVLVGSYTKTFCPGFKVGFILHHKTALEGLATTIANWRINPVFPAQAVLEMAIRSGDYARHLEIIKSIYTPRAAAMAAAIRKHFPETMELPFMGELNGGGFAIIMIPRLTAQSEPAFRAACKKAKVILEAPSFMPKDAFNKFVAKHDGLPYRVTFLSLPPADIHEGIDQIAEVVKTFRL